MKRLSGDPTLIMLPLFWLEVRVNYHKFNCESLVEVVVNIINRRILRVIGASLGSHRSSRVRTIRPWAQWPLRAALGGIVRGCPMHRAPLRRSATPLSTFRLLAGGLVAFPADLCRHGETALVFLQALPCRSCSI